MPSTTNGATSVVTQISERFETDRFGVDSIEMTVEIPNASFPSQMLVEFAEHPDFSSMLLTRRTGQRGKPGWWTVNYVFEGFLVSLPDPTYELTTSLSQEPIQTHPDFATFAGTPSTNPPINGSVFVDPDTGFGSRKSNAIWKEFAFKGTANEKAGIESYLAPGAEWRETKFQTSRPTGIRDVGTIETPAGSPPTLSGRNWLAWGETYVRRGHIYQVTSTWKLSGRNGWDTDIYS
nr:hypothetical protein [uncultured Mediterranean phage uvMED]